MKRFRTLELVVVFLVGPLFGGVVINGLFCAAVAFAVAGVGPLELLAAAQDVAALDGQVAAVQRAIVSLPVTALNLALTVLFFVGPPVLLARVRRVDVADAFGLVAPAHRAHFFLAPLGVLALGPLSDGLVRVMQWAAPAFTFGALDQIAELVRDTPLPLALLLFAAFPGVGEEFLFRGFLQRALGRGAVPILVSGVTFAMIHLDPHHVVGVLPVGFFLAYVADRGGSTLPTMVAHFVNNVAAVLSIGLVPVGATEEPYSFPALAAGLFVAAACVVAVNRTSLRAISPAS